MLKIITPKQAISSVLDIDVRALRARGVRFLLLDLDNTLVPWGERRVTEALVRWTEETRRAGLGLLVLSNGRKRRAEPVCAALGVRFLAGAGKPRKRAFRAAVRALETVPEACAYAGDQLFTDIIGANRAGLYSILVDPIAPREFFGTKISRLAERIVGRALRYTRDARQMP